MKPVVTKVLYILEWSRYKRPGCNQTELAEETGMAVQQWNRYVTGESIPRISTLQRIAETIGISLTALFAPPPAEWRKKKGKR